MKPVRWESNVAYVGKLEVGRILVRECQGTDNNTWVEMLGEFGHSPVGVFDFSGPMANVDLFRKAKAMVEENWKKLAELMNS